MYIPRQFEKQDIEVMNQLIREKPLATLVTISSHGLNANHIPMNLVSYRMVISTYETGVIMYALN